MKRLVAFTLALLLAVSLLAACGSSSAKPATSTVKWKEEHEVIFDLLEAASKNILELPDDAPDEIKSGYKQFCSEIAKSCEKNGCTEKETVLHVSIYGAAIINELDEFCEKRGYERFDSPLLSEREILAWGTRYQIYAWDKDPHEW